MSVDIKVKYREEVKRVIGEGACSKTLITQHEDGGDSSTLRIEFHGNIAPVAADSPDDEGVYHGKAFLLLTGSVEIQEFLETMKHYLVSGEAK